jgi:hypothetical protein
LPETLDYLPERKVRHLYDQGKWDKKREKKWVKMSTSSRITFAKSAALLQQNNARIIYKTIVVNKQNVNESFRRDSNKLYIAASAEKVSHCYLNLGNFTTL